ncbi:protocadherin delta 1 [Schistosoma bovis]|uniref:Protocadherin delta 1 n=1 Tax=Schistosoma bovis TaxID=6184 RepID=A0A430Q231_SCHBO|nr:protocadherin delta 1 [Schistosoma bovis]
MITLVYGINNYNNNILLKFYLYNKRIIIILLEINYMIHYLYLLILLTEIDCNKQIDSNVTIGDNNNNNNNHDISSNQLTKSIIYGMNTINKYSIHDLVNNDQINHNDPITSSSSSTTTTIQLAFIVIEEVKIGSLIGNLLDKLQLQNSNWLLTNSLISNIHNQNRNNPFVNLKPIPYINLNQTTGDLIVRTRIDRETLCDTSGTCCHTERQIDYHLWSTNNHNHNNKLQIMNDDKLTGQLSMISPHCALRMLVLFHTDSEQFLEIIIYILDINDNTPRWVQSVIELEIPEHTTIGTGYQLPEAIDPDQGPMHTVVAYELENKPLKENIDQTSKDYYSNSLNKEIQDKKPFSLDVRALDNSNSKTQKFSLILRIEEDLDRETRPTYELILYAIDGGETVQSHSERHYTPSGTYSLPNVSNRHTGSVLIRVLLTDKNDNAPIFRNPDQVVIIPENTKPGTVIYQASANDLDSADHNSLVYKIGPSASAEVLRCFRLNSETGELILIMPLSYQNASVLSLDSINTVANVNNKMDTASPIPLIGHRIPIQVSDQIHITEMTLIVSIRKINMNPPSIHVASHLRLSSRGNQIWIAEDAQLGSLVAMINVIDSDDIIPQSRSNQLMSREAKSECRSKHDSFEVLPLHTVTNTDFKLVLKKSLDRETKSSHSVKIECWDSGEPPLTAETSILIQVDDINDSPPVFDRQFYFSKIKEGLDPSTPIIQVRATDADLGKNAEIIYRLVSQEYTLATTLPDTMCSSINSLHIEKNLISINENTGELISQIALDRESIALINCTVEAINKNQLYLTEDDKVNSMYKTSAQIIITIDDLNDCKPMFNESSYEFTVVEGQKPHYQVS